MNALIDKMTWKTVSVLGIMLVLFMVLILPHEARLLSDIVGSQISPDTSLYYTKAALLEMADNYGQIGRNYYIISRLRFDVVFPLIYGLFFASVIIMGFRNTRYVKYFAWIPLLTIGFDYLENLAVSIVFFRYPEPVMILPHIAGVMTLLKWLTLTVSVLLMVIALIRVLIRPQRIKKAF